MFQELLLSGFPGSEACGVPEGSSETFSRLPKRVIRGRPFPAKASVESKKRLKVHRAQRTYFPHDRRHKSVKIWYDAEEVKTCR